MTLDEKVRTSFERTYRDPHGGQPSFDRDEDGYYVHLALEFCNFCAGYHAGRDEALAAAEKEPAK